MSIRPSIRQATYSLTMLAVLIVAGAVVVPIGLMAILAYAVWRTVRRRWPIVEMAADLPSSDHEETVDV